MIRQLQLCLVWLVCSGRWWLRRGAALQHQCRGGIERAWCHYRMSPTNLNVSTRSRYFPVCWSIHFILLHRRLWFATKDVSCVICSSRMACMSWKALLAARHCVATPVLLSRRENRFGAMTLFHCSTIGLSINIFISYHNRYFNIVIFNIRVSIRVRGLNLVQMLCCVCSNGVMNVGLGAKGLQT